MPRRRKQKPVQFNLFGDPIVEETSHRSGEIIPLDFETHAVRMIMVKGQPWWILADVARVLGYKHVPHASRHLRSKHKGVHQMDTLGGQQQMLTVNEAGLYHLMIKSERPEAERFQDWICEEVLPTIRRTGTFSIKPRTRVEREAKRLGCDIETAKLRCDQFALNRETHARLASEGARRPHFKEWHNSAYRGGFHGMEAKDLRIVLDMVRGTPLDRMDAVPLAINQCAKAVVDKLAKQRLASGDPISIADQLQLLEVVTRELTEHEIKRFGPRAAMGITDDPRRGRILDIVQKQLPSAESA